MTPYHLELGGPMSEAVGGLGGPTCHLELFAPIPEAAEGVGWLHTSGSWGSWMTPYHLELCGSMLESPAVGVGRPHGK